MRVSKYVFLGIYIILVYVMCGTLAEPGKVHVAPSSSEDIVETFDDEVLGVFYGVFRLLADRMKWWLEEKAKSKVDNPRYWIALISPDFGYPSIANEIHIAMTYLVGKQRRGAQRYLRIDNLLEAYFYSFDLEHVHRIKDRPDDLTQIVKDVENNITQLLLNLRYDQVSETSNQYIGLLSGYLKDAISAQRDSDDIYVRVVTVGLMKNMMFVGEPNDEAVKQLKNDDRRADVESFELETKGRKVIANHVTFLGKLMSDMFGYVFNHITLLVALRKSGIDQVSGTEGFKILMFRGFLEQFQRHFIERYVFFKDGQFEPSVWSPMIEFLKYNAANRKISIYDFRTSDPQYEIDMWKLVENFLTSLLQLCENQNVEQWKNNRANKINVDKNADKSQLLDMMDRNGKYAFDVLDLYIKYFVPKEIIMKASRRF